MIDFTTYTLSNGLQVILHPDPRRTVCSVNVLYRVGSRHDPPGRTGLAHLFEHLMFAGSEAAPSFDDALQRAGGENNAYTTADYTMYYNVLPAANVATALWLESDRMRALRLTERILANEKRVVVEEFNETCIDEPYGDLYHHLNELIYPADSFYRWPVIGSHIEHIREIDMASVEAFYRRYYVPNNAILCIAGRFDPTEVRQQVAHYFADIPIGGGRPPEQGGIGYAVAGRRRLTTEVPAPAIYLHFPTVGRHHPDFIATDVLSYLLGGGHSSFLYRRLVRGTELFAEVATHPNDNMEAGGILVEAHPSEGVPYSQARTALHEAIATANHQGFDRRELEKVVNLLEQRMHYRDIDIGNRAAELALYALLGDPHLVNTETDRYRELTAAEISATARRYLNPARMVELEYLSVPPR